MQADGRKQNQRPRTRCPTRPRHAGATLISSLVNDKSTKPYWSSSPPASGSPSDVMPPPPPVTNTAVGPRVLMSSYVMLCLWRWPRCGKRRGGRGGEEAMAENASGRAELSEREVGFLCRCAPADPAHPPNRAERNEIRPRHLFLFHATQGAPAYGTLNFRRVAFNNRRRCRRCIRCAQT